jgi:NADH-quinone oxidoreductase subunit G
VLCTRCVRFMAEVAKAPQLGVFGRGSHEVVDVAPEFGKLESNYSGNIVDLCPVGALLNRDFRFRARAWFLSAAPSVCSGCSRGCSTFTDFMGQDVYRYRPRENEAVNKSWLCDQGRLSYKSLNVHRALQSTVGKLGDAREARAPEVASYVAMKLKPLLGQLSVVVSPTLSNEDLLATFAFARDVLQTKSVYVSGRPAGEKDFLLMNADKNPNRQGLEWIAKAFGVTAQPFDALTKALTEGAVKGLIAFGHHVPEAEETFAKRVEKLDLFIVAATNETKVTEQAHALFATATHVEDEGTFTQEAGITQRFRRAFPPKGDSQPAWKWAIDLARELGHPINATSSREVFKSLAPAVPELANFAWDKLAPMNQVRPGITTMAAASDGRPPGWREQGVPNLLGLTLPRGT